MDKTNTKMDEEDVINQKMKCSMYSGEVKGGIYKWKEDDDQIQENYSNSSSPTPQYTQYEFLVDFQETESFYQNIDEFSDELF